MKIFAPAVVLLASAGVPAVAAVPTPPAAAPAVAVAAPATAAAAPASKPAAIDADQPIRGKVKEVYTGGGYTYLFLEQEGKTVWVAVPPMQAAVGDQVILKPGIEMVNFKSKTLNRTFASILFSGGTLESNDQQFLQQAAHSSAKVPQESRKLKVAGADGTPIAKAEGESSRTVAEVWAGKASLGDKPVAVRGKVVKVSRGIMGKNWMYLRDGSGDSDAGTDKLVVTSLDDAQLGDVVTASGKVSVDRDFGGGYRYEIIMENASVKK